MARPKGTGNLQQERNGLWTARVGVNGRRICRSTGTADRALAERFLERILRPLGLGRTRLPLAEAWHRYEMSPNRRDVARATMKSKRSTWMRFARWMEANHLEAGCLSEVTEEAVAEYLAELRCRHSATTYNNHVCTLREMFRLLAGPDAAFDPWAAVRLRADDSVSRRELSLEELERLYAAAAEAGPEWRLLFATGLYTGLRLGDCCRLAWANVDLARQTIQVIPEKTRRHAHGRPVTIPIHPRLLAELEALAADANRRGQDYVNPAVAELYLNRNWELDDRLRRIFRRANIAMNVRMTGRSRRSVVASFHSLRHTFVSLSANAGVPLAAVQAIVGHTSTAMTRHYYHENEDALRRAVEAIPAIGAPAAPAAQTAATPARPTTPAQRLKALKRLLAQGLVNETEYAAARARILGEL
ncbi:MAG: tyrosine-type recombinase/integrase [Kiritimatiellae bacterium]|nr:tyrosine-type recombinase/integrase [Kiritimatiellia bacterium]